MGSKWTCMVSKNDNLNMHASQETSQSFGYIAKINHNETLLASMIMKLSLPKSEMMTRIPARSGRRLLTATAIFKLYFLLLVVSHINR